MKKLVILVCVMFILLACRPPSSDNLTSCVDLSSKIKSLPLAKENIIAPQNTDLPTDLIALDIYEITDQYKMFPSSQIPGRVINCKGKLKLPRGNYPIEFYLVDQDNFEHIVVESQGKRKWIFKWQI